MALLIDKYFEKTQNCVKGGATATYGVFLRHDVVCAVQPAIDFIKAHSPSTEFRRHFAEGAQVPAEKALFSYRGPLSELVVLETEMLMRVGISCISAHNAYRMSMACPHIPFLDMHARHAAGPDMVKAAAYGASMGSKTAKLHGALGFIGSSLDATAPFYGTEKGLGTMPHVLVGLAGSTLDAVKLFVDSNPDDSNITALVDYYGREYTDSLEVAEWFKSSGYGNRLGDFKHKTLGVRLDTHGGRFAEGLDYEKSVEIVGRWLHIAGEWQIVRAVMGDDVFEIADDAIRDRVRAVLFGKGVSAANIMHMRNTLDAAGQLDVKITASSGFNPRKCKIMAQARAPINLIGTGSFLPETMSETYATADVVAYDGKPSVKVGRESLQRDVFLYWLA